MAEAPPDPGTDSASQAREAQRSLGPLLRRRGTSVEVGQRLRRAIQHLDMALSAPEVASNEIRSAVGELTACAETIRASERKSDQEQFAGVTSALAALGNLRSARTGTLLSTPERPIFDDPPVGRNVSATVVLPIQDPVPTLPAPTSLKETEREPEPTPPLRAEAPRPPSIPRPRELTPKAPSSAEPGGRHFKRTATGHGASVATVSNLCSRISALHRRRLTLLDDVGTTWNDLAWLEADLARCALALSWAVDPSPAGVEELGEMTSGAEPIDPIVALLHVGGEAAIDHALAAARDSCADRRNAKLFVDALRFAASDSLLAKARGLFAAPAAGPLRAALVPFLAERGALSSEDLIGLARDERDPGAPAAIHAIAYRGCRELAAEILAIRTSLATDGSSQEVMETVDALAFASVVVGERAGLDEVRRRVDSDPEARASLIDALALAGDESDAERLLEFAERGGPTAMRATLAAGHLGFSAVLPRLDGLKAAFGENLIDRARTEIVGHLTRSPPGPGRLLRGRLWTVEGAVERLEDQDELVLSQTWIALELSVRTGIPMPGQIQPGASTKELKAIAAAWRLALRQARLPRAGEWLYFGRPMRRPA